jgi:predicted lipoprotein with Yx(FWY)xxD motif
MYFRTSTRAAALTIALLSGCAAYPTAPSLPAHVEGRLLVGANGMTLYTFDKDTAGSGKSACYGPCAGNWPPLFAADSDQATGDWSIVVRDDGKKQWAFKGKPLYFWSKDQKAGDKTGDGFNNAWRIAR